MTDINRTSTKTAETVEFQFSPAPAKTELSVSYILAQMAAIQNDTAYLHKALDALTGMLSGSDPKGFFGGDISLGPGAVMADDPRTLAADAIKHSVMSRETTNQQLLRMYEAMLWHLLPGMDSPTATE